MPYAFKDHGNRLMQDYVSPGNFGGFLVWSSENRTETIYAVDRATGEALQRTDKIGCAEFDKDNWTPCETVPNNAEWIGNYPAPKARARLTQMQRERGTRIEITGKIGGWQS